MDATISLRSDAHTSDEVVRLRDNIYGMLKLDPSVRVGSVAAESPELSADEERRAEPVSLAAIGLAIVTSGALVSLINTIRAMSKTARDTEVEYTVQAPDGSKIHFRGSDLNVDQGDRVLQSLERALRVTE